jgi:hypothetical protein
MTDELRQQVARLRDLSPRLNRVTDEAAKIVQLVESLLNDECKIGMTAKVTLPYLPPTDPEEVEVQTRLVYGRLDGKYKLYVAVVHVHPEGEEDVVSETAWPSCTRDLKLWSFQYIPELLAQITERVDRAIQQTEGASKTISKLLRVFDDTRKEAK